MILCISSMYINAQECCFIEECSSLSCPGDNTRLDSSWIQLDTALPALGKDSIFVLRFSTVTLHHVQDSILKALLQLFDT